MRKWFKRKRNADVSVDRRRTVGKSEISIGKFTYGDETLIIKQWNEGACLRIGRFCSIAKGTTIFLGGNHRTDWSTTYPFGHINVDKLGGAGIVGHPATKGDVEIGNDVWIGADATIMSGVTIGSGAVIAARAVVVRDVEPYTVVGGNPAALIAHRFEPGLVDLLMRLRWWDAPIELIRKLAPVLCTPPTYEGLQTMIRMVEEPGDIS